MAGTIGEAINRVRAARAAVKIALEYSTTGNFALHDAHAGDAMDQMERAIDDLTAVAKRLRSLVGYVIEEPSP